MRFSFIIIDDNDNSVKEMLGIFENFPNYFCAGIIKDNQNAVKQIIKLKPQLVFVSIPPKTGENTFNLKNIEELFQYAESIPYFITINKTEKNALEAIQSGVSDYIIGNINTSQLGKSLFKFSSDNILLEMIATGTATASFAVSENSLNNGNHKII